MRVLAALIAAALLACSAPLALAQPVPDALRSAGVSQAQWDAVQREARAQARRANISEAALMAAAEAASVRLAGSGRFNALSLQQTLIETLAQQADQIAELQRRLDALTGDADPSIAALFAQARAALNEGRLDDADRLLAQVAERDLAALQQADAEAERRRLRAGETIASRGQVAFVQADYLGAAAHYERVAGVVPENSVAARWRYAVFRAAALYNRSRLFGEPEALTQAIAAYEAALTLRTPSTAPADWAATQNDLGNALYLQSNRGATGALERAREAYEAALTVRTPASDPLRWARTQSNLANVLLDQGERGERGDIERAIAAYEAVLEVQTREGDPSGWAATQAGLGAALLRLGERGAPGALERAAAAYEAALSVRTREGDPARWAETQMNLGNVFITMGANGAHDALDRAVAAYEAALAVRTREADPAGWAMVQTNLGTALWRQALQRGTNGLEQAVMAYEAALTVRTREADPAGWATLQSNLGSVLLLQGQRGEPDALERAVAAFHAALTVRTRAANVTGWADTHYNLALAYRALGRSVEALDAAQAARDGAEQIGDRAFVAQASALIAAIASAAAD